jgi:PAS domain S-box-containing protein
MTETTRVDFHCHSTHSDGVLTPRELALQLAADKVAFAALTDHDSVDGLAEFQRVLAQRGVGFIPGVELTVQCRGREAHLLAYGMDPLHPDLQATLHALKQAQPPGVQSIAETIRLRGTAPAHDPLSPGVSSTTGGLLEVAQAIELVHRAGGKAFLAHPLVFEPNLAALRELLIDLKTQGLDGLEALYAPFTRARRDELVGLAGELGLVVSGGTDAHERRPGAANPFGTLMPTPVWKQFRDAVCAGGAVCANGLSPALPPPRRRPKWRHFIFHFIFPALLALTLFAGAMFGVFLPTFQRSLMERKREMIRELTNSAWSILAEHYGDEKAGTLTRAQAQAMARSRIEGLRYGRESKDYFWLQDLEPRIIMHPYRKDLDGQNVSEFRDARGVRIFVEFAQLVRQQGEGYIEYYWQWKDDPSRVVPKESYIRGFQAWGWIIGTGIYLDDVRAEIARVQRNLMHTLLLITAVVALLLLYVMQQSLALERERSEAEESLRDSTDRYRSLVEATTEGTLLVLDGRCRYANPIFLDLLGYAERELGLLDLADLLVESPENEAAWVNVRRLQQGETVGDGFDGVLRRRDGVLVECVFSLSRMAVGEEQGFILLTRDVSLQGRRGNAGAVTGDRRLQTLQQIVDDIPTGVFRARATARGTLTEVNRVASEILTSASGGQDDAPLILGSLFPEAAAYDSFLAELLQNGSAECRLTVTTEAPSTRTIDLQAVLVRDDKGAERFVDGVLADVTAHVQRNVEREAVAERLQASLLFLHEPVGSLQRRAVFCDLQTPLHSLAAMITAEQATAALVRSEAAVVVGIITDHDLRARVVATAGDLHQPAYQVMTSPLVTIDEHAQVYEALLRMEERGVQHLAVTDESGQVSGVLRNQELLQFQSYGAIVLNREIARAATAEEVVRSCRRTPGLVHTLIDSGAHPDRITRLISSVCDAATERFIALAQAELGPAPVPFAFIALGSQGRQEQTLYTDQDNAIIYETPDGGERPAAAAYLVGLGEKVCGWLDQAGYPFCRGQVMAQNPRWVQPLSVWKQYFSEWIHKAEPQQLLEFSIFFDFRTVHGDAELAPNLRRHVHRVLQDSPSFLPHFAQNSLLFKPPLRLFGRIVSGGEQAGHLNLKDAMMPIVNFARLYSLRQELHETGTLERLTALVEHGVLPQESQEETAAAYNVLMRLRLRNQAEELQSGRDPSNVISTRKLRHHEETLLNQSFAQITAIQKRLSQDYLGGSMS